MRKSAREQRVLHADSSSNASSLPPRLPYLSDVLRLLTRSAPEVPNIKYTILAVSYRGFWTSKGRPSQKGIELDIAATLDWVSRTYVASQEQLHLVLWGQSIGAGIATVATAQYTKREASHLPSRRQLNIDALLLETPFVSVRHMLATLYPQRWLPYRYLYPFLRNHWDSREALQQISSSEVKWRPKILILQAGEDELVPQEHGIELEALCMKLDIDVQRKEISGAFHTEVIAKGSGRQAIADFLTQL